MKDRIIGGIILSSVGYITVVILATIYMHSIKIEEERWCVSPTGHKRVPCE